MRGLRLASLLRVKEPMAGLFASNRKLYLLVLCAFFAGPFCLSAKAQAVQAETGSNYQSQPAQAQPAPAKSAKEKQVQAESKAKKHEKKKKEKKQEARTGHQKKIKVMVVHEDKKKKGGAQAAGPSVAPDKVLYQRSIFDLKKGRYTEARLALQTLINSYPDSEYLAKAKLATADSYYKEGGISGLTQAVEEYKNFIIFFPFLDEAAYAQMQVGMAHFRMMEKPDRDTTQALEAEQEFQIFLRTYPKSPLIPQAEQHLRDVQEVLADGDFRIAKFYYLKQDYPASAARLMELVERYPLYSQTDQALWMLADIYERAKHFSKNEDEKNHWADLAGDCYTRIVKNYPLSSLTQRAKSRLEGMGMKVPAPDPQALARMKREQMYDNRHREPVAFAFLKSPLALFKSSPSVSNAAKFGLPTMTAPNDIISARDVLKQNAPGPNFQLANQQLNAPLQAAPPVDNGTPVDADTESPGDVPQGTGIGVQIIAPTTGSDTPPSAPQPAPEANGSQPAASAPANAPSGISTLSGTTISTPMAPSNAPAAATTPSAISGSSQPQPAAQPNSTPANGTATAATDPSAKGKKEKQAKAPKLDSSAESSSKKKKGIKKIIPW